MITQQLTEADYIGSWSFHTRSSRLTRIIEIAALLLIAASIALWEYSTHQRQNPQAGAAILFAAIVLGVAAGGFIVEKIFHLVITRMLRRQYRENKRLHFSVQLSYDDKALQAQSELGNSVYPWGHFTKWRENGDYILLYLNRTQYIPIIKTGLPAEDLTNIKQHLTNITKSRD